MEINTQLTQDLYVSYTESVVNGAGTTCCRFRINYKGYEYLADFSPDDELSDTSVIEQVGPQLYFAEVNNLLRVTHRDQFQTWYNQATA